MIVFIAIPASITLHIYNERFTKYLSHDVAPGSDIMEYNKIV